MNKLKLIRKSLQGMKRYQILFVVSVMLCMFVFSFYVIMKKSTEAMELEKTRKTFGSYTYYIGDLSEEEINVIEEDDNTKEYCLVTSEETEENQFLYANEQLFSFTNYSIIEGRFPETSNELLAPKWYLFQLGLDTDHLVGSTIMVTDPLTQNKVSKKVSGIYTQQESSNKGKEPDSIPTFISRDEGTRKTENCNVFVELKSVNHLEDYISQLREKLGLEEYQNISFNDKLLYQMRASEEGKSEGRQELALYSCLILAFLVFILMVQKTLIHLCLARWKKVLLTYKMLGVNLKEVRNYILCFSVIQTVAGLLFGIIEGYVTAYLFLMGSIKHWNVNVQLIITVPHRLILFAASILITLCVLVVFFNMRKFNWNSAYNEKQSYSRKGSCFHISFYKSGSGRRIKYAVCNSLYYIKQKSGILFTVVLCMLLVTFLETQREQSVKQVDNNNQYEYKFDVQDYFSIKSDVEIKSMKEIYEKLINLLTEKGKTVYYDTGFLLDFKLEKNLLTPEYIEKLKEDLDGYHQYTSGNDTIDTKIVVMGYSQEMLQEMLDSDFQLADEEAVMLSRTVDNEKNYSVPIGSAIGNKYKFTTSLFYESGQEQLFLEKEKMVVAMTENLLIYPAVDEETLCILIDLDEYNHSFNNDYINSFYIKNLSDKELSEIQDLLKGIDGIQVINQAEEQKQQEMNETQKIFLLYAVLILCNILAGISLLLQEIHEIDIRKKDFDFLRKLGMSYKDQSIIMGMELTITNFSGLLLGCLLCKICLSILYSMAFLKNSKMNPYIICFCFALALCYTLISYAIAKRVLFHKKS